VAAGVTGMAGDAAIGTIGTAGVTGTTGVSGVTGADPASETGMFTGIGRMRIAAGQRTTVVLSIVFPYSPADRPFAEELAGKIPVFRQIARDYFAGLSRDELDSLDEQKAKAEILRGFNDELRLGQIALLLFNDLLVLE
jgi:flagellar basal body-associated protein FliL